MKLIDPKQAKEFASTFFGDPILKMAANAVLDNVPTIEATPMAWIPVAERLPESGKHVLVACEVRACGYVQGRYVCDGYYAAAKSITGSCEDGFSTEYDEETDEFYLTAGWYEVIKNWDDYNSIVIHDFVTHWMALPEPPEEENNAMC